MGCIATDFYPMFGVHDIETPFFNSEALHVSALLSYGAKLHHLSIKVSGFEIMK